jgi:hypothetical protein
VLITASQPSKDERGRKKGMKMEIVLLTFAEGLMKGRPCCVKYSVMKVSIYAFAFKFLIILF